MQLPTGATIGFRFVRDEIVRIVLVCAFLFLQTLNLRRMA